MRLVFRWNKILEIDEFETDKISYYDSVESWFTNSEQTPLNRSQQLPAPYKRFNDEMKQN